mmetsp:Transcript_14606/g.31781  ORF Transcript_14606/g.31781 Transcript_14606/m.31781 type:complete len:384 (+) Transcript_14606:87-1238(+)|eukprot:CAMPEP_0172327584 /NCGR_PEP_ID=MMETSP1058-20130122/59908_1 /TAXON_ID=83371 /ORGANISM="Detonula confervacea, Strain CCMP 353" /LENGTH=383 /DNA_ID=CAMNT_0013044665 /DNA_START=35 /DNA_END=1186 /DNA_ORIENTATION=+
MSSKKRSQTSLFSTLASIDETDKSATKRRKQSQLHSLQQSRAAADQTKLNGILLELRILTQRCLTEGSGATADDADADADGTTDGDASNSRVKEEVDALLENLLVARRDLMGHQLGDDADDNDATQKKDVDYASLITKKDGNDETSSDEESSTDSSSGKNNNSKLNKQLNNEYTSLQNHWKSTLNKHHSNLALHSGMSVNSSKFQSKAVDVSFWEQVQGGMEHDRFKQRRVEDDDSGGSSMENLQFDDSKLYQQMLKDFISSSQSNGASTKTNKRGMMMDPAQEAASRLKRAMRKKSGGGADIDLTSLLTEGTTANDSNFVSAQNVAMMKKKAAVDRRASKGRKIRYAVLPKLVNFTFPVSRPEPMIKEDVWFKSLFGGVGRI